MNRAQIIQAALLAAALAAAAPTPAEAQDPRTSQLLKVLLLLKGAPQLRAARQPTPAAPESRTAIRPVRPTRPTVSSLPGPTLLAAQPHTSPPLTPLLDPEPVQPAR